MLYQDFSEPEKLAARRRGLALLALLNVLALALILSYGLAAWRDFRDIVDGDQRLHITLTGEGRVSVRPDVAKMTATILTQSASLEEAQGENSKKSGAVVAYLKGQGVGEKDIKTAAYLIHPQYRYPRVPPCLTFPCPLEDQRPRIVGYEIRNSFEVTLRDLAKTGAILAGVVSAGANEVSGLAFTIDETERFRTEARTKAVADARAKAKALARDLNRRVGKITNFSEGGAPPPPIFLERGVAADGKGGGGLEPPAVEPGENEIVIAVSITYEFK